MQTANVPPSASRTTAPLSFLDLRQMSQTAKKKNTVQTAAYGFSRETAL